MILRPRFCAFSILAFACALTVGDLSAQASDPNSEIVGLWKAKQWSGSDAQGPLFIQRNGTSYSGDMVGLTFPVTVSNGEFSFELPNRQGGFRGRLVGNTIRGIWFSSPIGELGGGTPVYLVANGPNRWSGQVLRQVGAQTLYLPITKRPDGTLAAFLRNIERDWGGFLGVRGVIRNGNAITLVGGRAQNGDSVLVRGTYDTAEKMMKLDFGGRGGTFDFTLEDDPLSDFYPRGKTPGRYVYRVPPALDDGWATASVEQVGIDRAGIERAVQAIVDMPMDSINAPQVHAVLIARNGKLVLEEYFHGDNRDYLHNERSAAKSVSATIIGATMLAGAPIKLSTPVYQVMNGGTIPASLELRKRAMTLENLMTMSSGYFCDDNNDDAPGNEDQMWQKQTDFVKFTLGLPLAFAPGDTAIYCSVNPNLALNMTGRAAGESPFYLFDRLVATPMGITRYIWPIDRVRNPYGGGGLGLMTRDFIKFGQLMLDDGSWHGRRILSDEFVRRASSTLMKIAGRDYGLLWWPQSFTVDNRTIRGFAALGNGGQIVMVFPELKLVVATNGGSYASRGWRFVGGDLMAKYILPSVKP
ncbi:MAG TPA: serine hydrolase [Gemmatimonadaceae bacterium]|nr:serine hydrolase [Gemmatimonadaceae bacterium]